jgi:hypothetical protein
VLCKFHCINLFIAPRNEQNKSETSSVVPTKCVITSNGRRQVQEVRINGGILTCNFCFVPSLFWYPKVTSYSICPQSGLTLFILWYEVSSAKNNNEKSHDRKNKYLTRLFFIKYLGFHFRFLVKHFPFIRMNFTSAFALACISDRKRRNIFLYKALSNGNYKGRHSLNVHKFTLFTRGCSNWNDV